MSNRILVKMNLDFGRCGELSSVFVTTPDELETFNTSSVDFGEALGKHSNVSCVLEPCDFTVVSTDQDVINHLVAAFNGQTICGLHPSNFIVKNM